MIATDERTSVYEIPEENLAKLQDQIAGLNKRALKLKLPPIEVITLRVEDRKVPKYDHNGHIVTDPSGKIVEVWARYHHLEIDGEAPRLKGWAFVATIEHVVLDGGASDTLISALPGQEVPERFRSATFRNCDHCHQNRQRRNTYILRHDESGRYVQVGSNCLGDFLGTPSPQSFAALAELLASARACCEAGSSDDIRRERGYWDLADYLAWVAGQVRRVGWLSRSKARDEGSVDHSTASQAEFAARAYERHGLGYRANWSDEPTWVPDAADVATAQAALVWAVEWTEDDAACNDYQHNVRTVVRRSLLDERAMGVAASIIPVYGREQAKLAEERARTLASPSAHRGTVGKREVFTLRVVGATTIEGDYGPTTIYRFVDPDGSVFTWFASSPPMTPDGLGFLLEEGVAAEIKATVKKHDEYKGVKQTIITRAVVQKII